MSDLDMSVPGTNWHSEPEASAKLKPKHPVGASWEEGEQHEFLQYARSHEHLESDSTPPATCNVCLNIRISLPSISLTVMYEHNVESSRNTS